MMPHTLKLLSDAPHSRVKQPLPISGQMPLRSAKARLFSPPLRRGGSAELSTYESRDPSTQLLCFCNRFCLREDPDDGFGSRAADEDPAALGQLAVHTLDLGEEVRPELA